MHNYKLVIVTKLWLNLGDKTLVEMTLLPLLIAFSYKHCLLLFRELSCSETCIDEIRTSIRYMAAVLIKRIRKVKQPFILRWNNQIVYVKVSNDFEINLEFFICPRFFFKKYQNCNLSFLKKHTSANEFQIEGEKLWLTLQNIYMKTFTSQNYRVVEPVYSGHHWEPRKSLFLCCL